MIEPDGYQDYLKLNERQKHFLNYFTSIETYIAIDYKNKLYYKFVKIFGRGVIDNKIYVHFYYDDEHVDIYSLYSVDKSKYIECAYYEKHLKKIKREQKYLNKILIKVSQNNKRSRL